MTVSPFKSLLINSSAVHRLMINQQVHVKTAYGVMPAWGYFWAPYPAQAPAEVTA